MLFVKSRIKICIVDELFLVFQDDGGIIKVNNLSESVEELSMRTIIMIADIRDQMNLALDSALEQNFINSSNYLIDAQKELTSALNFCEIILGSKESDKTISFDLVKTISEMSDAIHHDFDSMKQLIPLLEMKFSLPVK